MDIQCPYCEHYQDVNHDDGYGYEEDMIHEMQCEMCEKNFAFTTSITFLYDSFKADCLNGSDHEFQPTITYPVEYSKMQCKYCGDIREPSKQEMDALIEIRKQNRKNQ